MLNLRLEAIKGIVRKLSAKWRSAPPIDVVPTAADLPVPAPVDVRGLYWRKRVWVVADQPIELIAKTLNHEVVAHHGLRVLLKGRWRNFMDALHRGSLAAKDRPLRKLRDQVRKTYVDRRGRCTLRRRTLADEISAAAVEDCTNPFTGEFKPKRWRWKARFSEVVLQLRSRKPITLGYQHLMAALRAATTKLKKAPAA